MDPSGNGHKAEAPSTVLTMTITMDQLTGQVQVTGPINNQVISFGMLELAKQAIHDLALEQAKGTRIVSPAAMPFIKH